MVDVSIIVVTYNTLRMTSECIESIFAHTYGVVFEVILVDNASNDGSKQFFEEDTRIRYIYSKENLGFGRANNLGYESAQGNYIFLLNSDTLLLNNAVKIFYDFMETSPSKIGCIGCELIDGNDKPIGSYGDFPGIRNFLGRILLSYKLNIPLLLGKSKGAKIFPLVVDYVTGADLFIRRKVIDECGFFDPDFFMYFEETEMQFRYKKKGYISQIINTPAIKHFHGASNKKEGGKRKSLTVASIELESRFIYCSKTMAKWKQLIVSWMHLLLIPRILLYNSLMHEKSIMIRIILDKCL